MEWPSSRRIAGGGGGGWNGMAEDRNGMAQ